MTDATMPPEVSYEGLIRRVLYRISDQWAEMLIPPGPRPGTASGGALDDDHEVRVFDTLAEAALASAPDVPRSVLVLDVRRQVTLADYTGELRVSSTVRITDRMSGTGAVTLLAILAFCVITLHGAGRATPSDTEAAAIAAAASPRGAFQ